MTDRVPDFFIIGAPKCGTTSLAEYLRAHSGVWFSEPKEPSFYNSDTQRIRMSREEYLGLFAEAPRGLLLGEGSTPYLLSKVAVGAILRDNPKARLIVLLREPLAMLRSLHNHYLARRIEDVEDFAQAWDLQARRAHGEAIPPYCIDLDALQYAKSAQYSAMVERLFETAPRDQIQVHISEEFFKNPRDGYLKTLRFLGLDDDGRTDFRVHNQAFVNILRTPLAWLHRARTEASPPYVAAKQTVNALGLRPGAWLVNVGKKGRRVRRSLVPLDPKFARRVRRSFEPDIDRLEVLLDRDLSMWRVRDEAAGRQAQVVV